MSTRKPRLEPDVATLPEALRDPIDGVTLGDYVVVEAARLDDIPDASVLRWLGIRAAAFERAEEVWSERVADELTREGSSFDEVYEELLGRALALWSRAVAPLDSDVVAYVQYQRELLAADDPQAFSRELGLTAGDEIRLARRWRARLEDESTRQRAAASLDAASSRLGKVTLDPVVFPPTRDPS